jgi:hypothetical protein
VATCLTGTAGAEVGAVSADLHTIVGRGMAGADGDRVIGTSSPPSEASIDAGDWPKGATAGAAAGKGRGNASARATVGDAFGTSGGVVTDAAAGKADGWLWADLSGGGLAAATASGFGTMEEAGSDAAARDVSALAGAAAIFGVPGEAAAEATEV